MKRNVSIMLLLTMLVSLLSVYPAAADSTAAEEEAPLYNAEELIEFENGRLTGAKVTVGSGVSASGGHCLTLGGTKLVKPSVDSVPDMSYRINIPADGTYCIYMRYISSGDGTDSINYKWDDGKNGIYSETATTVTGTSWGWFAIKGEALTAGIHKLDFLHRELYIVVDAFVVTTNYKAFDTAAVEKKISEEGVRLSTPEFAANSTATTIQLTNGHAVFEAESLTEGTDYVKKVFTEAADNDASGGKALKALSGSGSTGGTADVNAPGLEFNFVSDIKDTVYNIWVRIKIPGTGADSAWISYDGNKYTGASNFGETEKTDGVYTYEWRKIGALSNVYPQVKHNVRLYPREWSFSIDKLIVTSDIGAPSGMEGSMEAVELPSKYPAPTITPTSQQHPRLYFTSADIPDIKENMYKTQNATALKTYEKHIAKYDTSFDGSLGMIYIDAYTNYSSSTAAAIEAFAFKYAIDGDENYGRRAIDCVLNMLKSATWDINGQDVTRPMGHTIFVASEVYDWCYDLLEDSEKNEIIKRCESIASLMEVGYPPKGQGAVCGHAGEAQLLRDLVGFGIATYDERPDIYNYVAGRLLSEFVKPRNFWYESETHHQGDAYGAYRYNNELLFQLIMYRMTGGKHNGGVKVFNDTQGKVPYYWIYTRRPDGQYFRTGDCYNEKYTTNSYWDSCPDPMFFASNFYGDSIIKGEYDLQNPTGAVNEGHGIRSSVAYLLFNDPDLEGNTDKTSLPLTHYFGSPNGLMMARTGWDVDCASPADCDDVVAMMKIGERWGANHHHLDAGNFQLYYKGILASESGYYESYGSLHDQNYNKASIAHNVITVYNPNERLGSTGTYTDRYGNTVKLTDIFPYGVNDGGQRRPGGEPTTWEIWNGDTGLNYDTGKVLDHAFGPDENKPEYTYIKGDITQAYSSEAAGSALIDRKVENVTRSMVFMPLENESYPAIMVIMDKVKSTNPEFKKKWLLHTQLEPEVDSENGVSVIKNNKNGYNGKLTVQTLLPKNAEITKVGGEGKRYWIGRQDADSNFDEDGYNFDTLVEQEIGGGIEAGWGRIEVSPSAASAEDKFLNVLAVSDADNTAEALDSELIEGNGLVGVKTAGKVLMFADVNTPSSAKNRVLDSASFTVSGTEKALDIMIAGVKSGTWKVTNGSKTKLVSANEDGGVLYFEGGAGEYSLEYFSQKAVEASISQMSTQKNGDNYEVTLTLEGDTDGMRGIVALYNKQNRLVAVKVAACENGICRTELSAEETQKATQVRAFIWGRNVMPLSEVKSDSASEMFK